MKYRPELDGLRGVAVLTVLAAHAGVPGFAAEGGLAGVTLFFVLSGFLITALLLAELDEHQAVNLRGFYIRRGLRLFPALAALLIVVAVGSALNAWPLAGGDMRVAVPSVILYFGNWAQVQGAYLGPLGQTWSLAVEEQFYLLWPILLILLIRHVNRRKIGIAAIVLALLVTPWRAELVQSGDLLHALVGTDAHADALLFGCAIAILRVRIAPVAGWVGLIAVVAAAALWQGPESLVYMLPIATVGAALAVARCPSAIRWAPLAYVGRISYGLYLWHYLLIWWRLPWPAIVLLSFLAATGSYYAIERPFLRLKGRFRAEHAVAFEASVASA